MKTRLQTLAALKLEKRAIDQRLKALKDEISESRGAPKSAGITHAMAQLLWEHYLSMGAYANSIERRIKHLSLLVRRRKE